MLVTTKGFLRKCWPRLLSAMGPDARTRFLFLFTFGIVAAEVLYTAAQEPDEPQIPPTCLVAQDESAVDGELLSSNDHQLLGTVRGLTLHRGGRVHVCLAAYQANFPGAKKRRSKKQEAVLFNKTRTAGLCKCTIGAACRRPYLGAATVGCRHWGHYSTYRRSRRGRSDIACHAIRVRIRIAVCRVMETGSSCGAKVVITLLLLLGIQRSVCRLICHGRQAANVQLFSRGTSAQRYAVAVPERGPWLVP